MPGPGAASGETADVGAAAAGGARLKLPVTLTAQVRLPSQVGQVAVRASASARLATSVVGASPERVTLWPETSSLTQR
jgi:hypothetical protein